jgi:hypothetical protein
MKRKHRRYAPARLALVTVVALGGLSLGHGQPRTVTASTSVESLGGHAVEATEESTTRSDRATRPGRKAMAAPALTSVAVPWQSTSFTIRDLTPAQRFEIVHRQPSTAWPPTAVHDSYGVPMCIIGGYRRYHPVGLARLGLKYLYSFRRTGDPLYLDRAERIAAGLKRIAVSARGAIWFPYRFTFTMHGDRGIVNRPPWFSGMAQGLALSLFVRLWERTGRCIPCARRPDLQLAAKPRAGIQPLGLMGRRWSVPLDRGVSASTRPHLQRPCVRPVRLV